MNSDGLTDEKVHFSCSPSNLSTASVERQLLGIWYLVCLSAQHATFQYLGSLKWWSTKLDSFNYMFHRELCLQMKIGIKEEAVVNELQIDQQANYSHI